MRIYRSKGLVRALHVPSILLSCNNQCLFAPRRPGESSPERRVGTSRHLPPARTRSRIAEPVKDVPEDELIMDFIFLCAACRVGGCRGFPPNFMLSEAQLRGMLRREAPRFRENRYVRPFNGCERDLCSDHGYSMGWSPSTALNMYCSWYSMRNCVDRLTSTNWV